LTPENIVNSRKQKKRIASRRRVLGLEQLERREVLAGNVTASIRGGDLFVTGDNQGNDITIMRSGGSGITIVGNGTTVNGQAEVTLGNYRRNAVVNLNGGDDTVTFKSTFDSLFTILGNLNVTTGNSNDLVQAGTGGTLAVLGNAVIDVGASAGVDTFAVNAGSTVGGNLNQRPRCWYFRNEEFVCFKKGGSRCFAVNGENQYHAIFGNEGPSHIVHPSSLAVPFVAYGARFRVLGPNGEREIAAADYFTLPTMQNVLKENVLDDEDLLTHVILPAPGNVKHGHYEVRYKQSHDWPLAFTTVVLTMNGNTIASARVVLGAVAPIPWRSKAAEAALAGKPLNEQTAAAAGEAAVAEAKPMSGNAYKVQIAKTAVKRAVMQAAGLKTV
jgi:xanthine dehydrogenase YagS FAD-binding subunit